MDKLEQFCNGVLDALENGIACGAVSIGTWLSEHPRTIQLVTILSFGLFVLFVVIWTSF